MIDLASLIAPSARVLVSVVLGAIAFLHMLWSAGIWWPAPTEAGLVAATVGARGAARMPGPVPCLVVATGLLLCAALPWAPAIGALGRWHAPAFAVPAAIFALRGLLPLLPAWRRATAHEPFATLDRRLYAPLCLVLALCLGVLAAA